MGSALPDSCRWLSVRLDFWKFRKGAPLNYGSEEFFYLAIRENKIKLFNVFHWTFEPLIENTVDPLDYTERILLNCPI